MIRARSDIAATGSRVKYGGRSPETGPFWLVLPTLTLTALVVVYPTLYSWYLSFFRWNLVQPEANGFVGLENYITLLNTPAFWKSVGRALVFTFGSLIPQVVLGLGIASLLNYPRLRFRTLARGLIILPWLVPIVSVAIVWRWMLNELYGVVNYGLMGIGLTDHPILWLSEPRLAMLSLIISNVWRGIPLMVVMFLAGLQAIPEELYEAAKVDGASTWARYVHITLPLLKGVIGVAAIIRTVWMFNYFDHPWIMTFGGPGDATTTVPIYAYLEAFSGFRLGMGAAVTVLMFVVLCVFALLYFRVYEGVQEP